jgi:hypothetical protein
MFMICLDTEFNLPSFSGSLVFMIKGKAKWNTALCVTPLQKYGLKRMHVFCRNVYRMIFHDPTFTAANIAPRLGSCTDVWCYEMIHTDNGWSLVAWYRYYVS